MTNTPYSEITMTKTVYGRRGWYKLRHIHICYTALLRLPQNQSLCTTWRGAHAGRVSQGLHADSPPLLRLVFLQTTELLTALSREDTPMFSLLYFGLGRSNSLVGSTLRFGPYALILCIILCFLPHRIRIARLNGRGLEHQWGKSWTIRNTSHWLSGAIHVKQYDHIL